VKIVSISSPKSVNGKFIIQFDDDTEIKASVAQIADFGIYTGREFTEEEHASLCEAVSLGSAKARALRILGSRTMSSKEVAKRLIAKGDAPENASAAVEWLESIGAINDEEFAKSIVLHYSTKGYGMARIRDELYRRGIDRELWDDALSCIDSSNDSAYEFLVKKLRGNDDRDELRRAADSLVRRGYSYSEARSAVSRYEENIEEIREAAQ